jgi:hypothetical protein
LQATTAIPVSSVPFRSSSAEHPFYVGSAIVALAIATASFLPGLIHPAARRGPITPLVVVHAAVFTGWLVLYLVQSVLASTRNLRVHRRLGVLGSVLAVAMIVLGYRATIEMVRRGFDVSGDLDRLGPVINQTSFQLWGLPVFGGLVLAAILNRRRPGVHKRLMWLTIPPLLGAPVAHAIGHFGLPFVVAPLANFALLAANPVYDRIVLGRMHPVSLWGGVLSILFVNFLAVVVSPTRRGIGSFCGWRVEPRRWLNITPKRRFFNAAKPLAA